MSKSSPFNIDILVRMRPALVIASLLAVLTTTSTGILQAEDAADSSSERILVTCDLHENQPAGTLVTRLLDHHLTLKNFRLAEPQDDPVFTVDSHDGSVRVNRNDQMDFELHRTLRCVVLADEDLAEQDQYLKEFSAGLLEDGLSAGVFKSLSTGRVVFDIKIQLRDVPEPPKLSDAALLVQVYDESFTEIGTVAVTNPESFEELHYFIASGNEDDLFRIDGDTGALSLSGGDALHFDILSTHELVILAQDATGLSATANVVVSVFNETPQLSPLSAIVTAHGSERNSVENPTDANIASVLPYALPFGLHLKSYYEAESRVPLMIAQHDSESIPAENTNNHSTDANTDTDTDSAFVQPTNSILNTDAIDTAEVRKWLAETNNGDQPESTHTAGSTVTQAESDQPVTEAKSLSRGILPSVVALILFVLSCVAAAVAFSRTVSARRAISDDTSPINEATPATVASRQCKTESEKNMEPKCGEATKQLSAALNSVQSSEQICELQDQLASRDQLIAQLKKELEAVGRGFGDLAPFEGDLDFGIDGDSWDGHDASVTSAAQLIGGVNSLSQISRSSESETDVRSSLTTARDQLARELSIETRNLPGSDINFRSDTDGPCESTVSVVADPGESDNLRKELADLFASQSTAKAISPEPPSLDAVNTATQQADQIVHDDENSHHDSVKRYLSQLLERSKDSTSQDVIPADRRKADDQNRETTRRSAPASPSGRKPVKSFLESYMSAHGGELADVSDNRPLVMPVEEPEMSLQPTEPAKPRTPIDVQSIRESMNSFRAVAIQSVENAVLSHDLRQAKGKVAVRTMMIAGLIAVTIVVFLANMAQIIQFSVLNWLMVALVTLAFVELCLRLHSIRRQRKGLTSATLTPRPEKRIRSTSDDDEIPFE